MNGYGVVTLEVADFASLIVLLNTSFILSFGAENENYIIAYIYMEVRVELAD